MEYSYKHGKAPQQSIEIAAFQEKLNNIRKVYHGNWKNLVPDGIYGRNTRDAVKQFQIMTGVMPVTGNLDLRTQASIDYMFSSSNMTYNFFKPAVNASLGNVNYTNGGDMDWSSYVKPDETIAASITATPSTYGVPSKNKFVDAWKGPFNTLLADLDAIADTFIEYKKIEFEMIVKKVKPAIDSIKATIEKMGQSISRQVEQHLVKLADLESIVKSQGELSSKEEMLKVTNEKLSKASKAGKVAKGVGFAAIASQFLVVVYYGVLYYNATPGEEEEAKKNFKNALGAFFGSLLSSALAKILQIVATRIATGFVAGSVAPGAGNLVGTIVGIAIAVVDIILYFATGKTIGDRIWEGIKSVFEKISFNATSRWESLDYKSMTPAQIAYLGPGGVPMGPKW